MPVITVFSEVGCGEERTASIAQYAVAANATLINGEYSQANGDGTPAGWQTQGGVSAANNSAILREVAASQTRLSQVFMVGEGDRFLRFTLNGLALDNLSGTPQDAFEVSLNDANTGLPVLGGTGLSHSDAFLNIQSDGTEHKASAVTSTLNRQPPGGQQCRRRILGRALPDHPQRQHGRPAVTQL